ncbi:MAG TPA: hypothetical protein PLG34_00790 [Spirochaetota bacterium]|jgi:hypothetical protein|nr:MAG: hypothetical protein BWX91_00882 [Spirochaetes bacterium ADurb.Bin133]HNZ25971.1 hypothetical protein [Spirochaetota bacterium]HPY86504.1 hypothetical protein [Spirochaetota bacterium]
MDLHKFHFVINSKLLNLIKKEARDSNISVSKCIRKILKNMRFAIEKMQFESHPLYFKYNKINADKDIFINLDIENYLLIANVQDSLKLYSKAQVLRFILRTFFEIKEKSKSRLIESVLESMKTKWEIEKSRKKAWDKSHMSLFKNQPSIILSFSPQRELSNILLL